MKTVLNLNNPVNRTNKLFLGEPLGITNFADMKYPIFKRLYKEQLSFIWFPDEVSMVKDGSDIGRMTKTERFIFETNLAFQTAGDSFLGKGIEGIIGHVTNNELHQCLRVHSFFEGQIHTPSYSHIFENIYNDPAERFYAILKNPAILQRAQESTERFNQLLNNETADPRRDIINTFIGLLALESVSFYSSFLTSFFFSKSGQMTGTGNIIKLIARDEHLHKANTINVLKIITKEASEGFLDLKNEIEEKTVESFKLAAEQEFAWIDYLMSEGELMGLTKQGLKAYVKYLTNRALVDVGVKASVFEETANPFPWVVKFQGSSRSMQTANQERENTNYVKGSMNDMDSADFGAS